MRISCASVTLLTLAAALPAAETDLSTPDPASGDDTVVITADRRETPIPNSTASVDLIDAAEDRERGYALSPWEWLEGIAGVDAVPASGGVDGGLGRVRIRGANGYDTQWLVDGIPLEDPSTPQGYLPPGFLPPAGIRSIEVVRGAQSGLYGSRAVGGVVNVLTARPTAGHERLVRAEGGSYGTVRGVAEASGPLGDGLGYALAVDGLRSDGFSALTDADAGGDPREHEADGVERFGLNGRLEWLVHPTTRLYAALRGMALNQEFDGYAAPDDDQSFTQLRSLGAAVGSRSRVSERLSLEFDLSWSVSQRLYRAFSSLSGTSSLTDYDGDQRRAGLSARYRALSWLEIASGVDAARAGLAVEQAAGSVVDEHDWLGGGWLQLYSAGRHHDVSLSAREDLHSRAGDAATWRAAVGVHDAERRATLRGAVGTAFRAPSLYEQHDPFSGNAQLAAQESIGYEAGVRLAPVPDLALETTWFRTDYDSVITYFDPDGFLGIIPGGYANVSRYAVQGVENAFTADAWERRILLRLSYTWQEVLALPAAVDDTYSPYLPRHLASVSLALRGEPGWIRAAVTRRGAAPASIYDSHPRMEWATVLDLAAGWAIDRTWEVSLRLDNLLDEHYEVTPDYATSGRALYAGAAARF